MELIAAIRRHYGGSDVEGAILSALAASGVDTEALTVEHLSAVDQLHAGFAEATRHLFGELELGPDTRLLDVGCGIGGPARLAAADHGCPVVGIDLSPDFIRTARGLTERLGLGGRVTFHERSAADTGLEDRSFDRAMLVHVGMNLPDKHAMFAEVRRLLRPGGVFGIYEQMRIGPGDLTYPLPWAEDERSSFVARPEDYRRDLEAAGFVVRTVEDRTAATSRPGPTDGAIGPAAVFGRPFVERLANNIAATRAGILAPIVMIADAG